MHRVVQEIPEVWPRNDPNPDLAKKLSKKNAPKKGAQDGIWIT